jgi:agmatinase
MNFPNYFADAESSFDEAKIIIFGAPYDKTSSFRRGASKAPSEIRQASWNFETFNIKTGRDLRDVKFHDYGDLEIKADSPKDMVKKIRDFTSLLIKKNKFPIAIGGEHSITPGIVQAFPKDTAVLCLDAHLDFRQSYEDEPYNHACTIRRIADHIDINNIAVLGTRSAEKEEFEDAKNQNLFFIDSFDIKKSGIKKILDNVKDHLGNKKIYFTLDIDVFDLSYAPGTSTPEPFGLTQWEILDIIDFFSSQFIGFDIVEVCPPYDNGQTSILAAKIIRYIIESVSFKKSWLA